jgi:apolipoprotein N-acyltransferase
MMNKLLTALRGPWAAPVVALAAGALFVLALSPFNVWGLALLSPVLLAELLAGQRPGRAARIGWMYGIGLWGAGVWWLYISVHDYGNTPAWLSVIMVGLVAVIMGALSALMAYIYRRAGLDRRPLLTFAPLFIAFEWMRSWLFTGFPWLYTGYALLDTPLQHYAPVLGVFGVGLLAVISGQCAAALLKQGTRAWRSGVLLALVWGAGLALGLQAWSRVDPQRYLSLSIIQGNIPQDVKWQLEWRDRTLDIYRQWSKAEWGHDLVIWPEAAIPMFQYEAAEFLVEMENNALTAHSTLVTGIPFADLKRIDASGIPPFYNSLAAIGQGYGLYFKQRLVPFGEYIPFEALLRNTIPFFSRDMSSFSAGTAEQMPLMVRDYRAGAAICYEVAYPELTRRNARNADFLITVSNDGWFGHSIGPDQHLQMVRMRSLENGKWFVRATNNGISAIINQDGKLVATAPQFKRTVLRSRVYMTSGQTPYLRFGYAPVMGLCVLMLGLGVWRGKKAA